MELRETPPAVAPGPDRISRCRWQRLRGNQPASSARSRATFCLQSHLSGRCAGLSSALPTGHWLCAALRLQSGSRIISAVLFRIDTTVIAHSASGIAWLGIRLACLAKHFVVLCLRHSRQVVLIFSLVLNLPSLFFDEMFFTLVLILALPQQREGEHLLFESLVRHFDRWAAALEISLVSTAVEVSPCLRVPDEI